MKIIKWFKRVFIYRVYQKSYMTDEGMMVINTYLSGDGQRCTYYLSKESLNKVLWVYETERKIMEKYRYDNFGC
jgi:hypothetical protein